MKLFYSLIVIKYDICIDIKIHECYFLAQYTINSETQFSKFYLFIYLDNKLVNN